MNRFGNKDLASIREEVASSSSINTKRCQKSNWEQFVRFCEVREFDLSKAASPLELSKILEDYAFNMKKVDGVDYKETSIKTIWNTTAKLLQDLYFNSFGVKINPFSDIEFKSARIARDAKRKQLQGFAEKRKVSSAAIDHEHYNRMVEVWSEETPSELQKKFYLIAARELAWRGGEAATCLVHFFKEEIDLSGQVTGRYEYNPIFSKTCQGGSHPICNSKWLIPNIQDPDSCPVRLLKKILEKRGPNVKSDRLFLTENPSWKTSNWFKNTPVGINTISKWTKLSAERAGLDVKRRKITNHSTRSTAVTQMVKAGVSEQEVIKITGHQSAGSIRPYLQLDQTHHVKLINNLRQTGQHDKDIARSQTACSSSTPVSSDSVIGSIASENSKITYNNCVIHNNYYYKP